MCYNVANLRIPFLIISASVMPRRPAVLLTPPAPSLTPRTFQLARTLLHFLYTVFVQKRCPSPFRSITSTLVHKNTRVSPTAFFQLRNFSQPSNLPTCEFSNSLSPLEATLTADLPVLQCFGRNRPLTTPLDAILTDLAPVTPLSATLTKKVGVGAMPTSPSASRMLRTLCLRFAGPGQVSTRAVVFGSRRSIRAAGCRQLHQRSRPFGPAIPLQKVVDP